VLRVIHKSKDPTNELIGKQLEKYHVEKIKSYVNYNWDKEEHIKKNK